MDGTKRTAFASAIYFLNERGYALRGQLPKDEVIRFCVQVAEEGRITNKEYQALFGVARGTALIDLSDLVTRGLLVTRGAGRGKHYVLATARNAQPD